MNPSLYVLSKHVPKRIKQLHTSANCYILTLTNTNFHNTYYVAPLLNNLLQAGLSTRIHPHSPAFLAPFLSTLAALMLEQNKTNKQTQQTGHKKLFN